MRSFFLRIEGVGSNDILVGKEKKHVKYDDLKNLIPLSNNLSNWSCTTNPNLIYLISPFPDNISGSDRIPVPRELGVVFGLIQNIKMYMFRVSINGI
jgi:hypothetical protein